MLSVRKNLVVMTEEHVANNATVITYQCIYNSKYYFFYSDIVIDYEKKTYLDLREPYFHWIHNPGPGAPCPVHF